MNYDDFYEWLANVAGVAGFILSLILAVSQLLANRLKIKASGCVLILHNRIFALIQQAKGRTDS